MVAPRNKWLDFDPDPVSGIFSSIRIKFIAFTRWQQYSWQVFEISDSFPLSSYVVNKITLSH